MKSRREANPCESQIPGRAEEEEEETAEWGFGGPNCRMIEITEWVGEKKGQKSIKNSHIRKTAMEISRNGDVKFS